MLRLNRFWTAWGVVFGVAFGCGGDTAPADPLNITTESLPSAESGAGYSASITATGGDAGEYQWAVGGDLPSGLELESGTPSATLSGTPNESGVFGFTVTVTDSAGTTATRELSLQVGVTGSELTISTTTLPVGQQGEAYAATIVAAGGSGAGYVWNVESGALPPGVALMGDTPSAALVGTPEVGGTFSFVISVTDDEARSTSRSFSIEVDAVELVIQTDVLPRANAAVPYAASVRAAGGTGTGFAWSVSEGALPEGLVLVGGTPDASVEGIATETGSFAFTLEVVDDIGASAVRAFTLEVVEELRVETTTLAAGQQNVAFAAPILASGGTSPYAWSVASGTLPAGVTLTSASPEARLEGTPSEFGTFEFTVQVEDADGVSARQVLGLEIVPPLLEITSVTLPSGMQGVPFSEMIVATGGTGAGYVWTVAAGAVPPGMSLVSGTPAATLGGTPTANGSFAFTVEVTDSGGASASQALMLAIAPPALTITTTTLPQRYVARPTNETLRGANGTETGYVWTVSAGSLPPGVALTSGTPNATLTGAPTDAGTFTFTLRLTDDGGNTDTQEFVWEIAPRLTITTASVPPGRQGTAYDASVFSTGGSGMGQRWDVRAGALPPGLSLSAPGVSVRLVGTPAASGTFDFTLRVLDSGGSSALRALTLTVASPPIAITTPSISNGNQAALYAATVSASGGSGSGYVWSVVSGSLPTGITVRGATPSALLLGAAAAPGMHSFTLRVTDDASNTATRAYSLRILGPVLEISPPSIPSGQIGRPYSASLTGSGGSGSGYTFVRTSGTLPPGLTLSSAGVISGTPSAGSGHAFTVRVQDSAGATLERDYAINVMFPQRYMAYVGDAVVDGQDLVMMADVSAATPGAPFSAVSSPVAGGNAAIRDGSFGWSPDNRYFAFIGDLSTDGSDDLYVVDGNAPSPTAVNLTALGGGRGVAAFRWSPDSRRLAVVADYDRLGDGEMGIFDLRGGLGAPLFTLTHANVPGGDVLPRISQADNTDFDWSVDSTKLYFRGDIVSARVVEAFMFDTANPSLGAQPLSGALDSNRSVSRVLAAGNDVAVVAGDLDANNREEVYAVSTAGGIVGPRVRLNPFRADGDLPFGPNPLRVSPGGRFVAFTGTFTFATPDAYLVDFRDGVPVEGSALNMLNALEGVSRIGRDVFDWSPRGDQLVFVANDTPGADDAAFVVDLRQGLPATGIQISPVITGFEDTDQVRWAPDGSAVVMLGEYNDDGVEELFYVDLSGPTPGMVVQLSGARTATSDVGGDPVWLPDSSAVIYRHDSSRDAHTELFRVTLATAMAPVRIHTQFPAWTGFNSAGVNQINDFFVTQDGQRVIAVGTDAFVDDDNEVILVNLPTLPNLTRVNSLLPAGGDIFTGALYDIERRE